MYGIAGSAPGAPAASVLLSHRVSYNTTKINYLVFYAVFWMFGSSLPQIVSMSLIYAICACLRLAVFNTFSFSGLSIFDCLFGIF
jgi:hypothetical protein